MWQVRTVGWLGRRHEIEQHGRRVASFEFGAWSERAVLTLGARELTLRRQGFWRPHWDLLENGAHLATARSASGWRRGYLVTHGGEEYALVPSSFLGRGFDLRLRGRTLGTIRPADWWGRRAAVELDEELAPELRLLAACLVILAWRRANTAAAAG